MNKKNYFIAPDVEKLQSRLDELRSQMDEIGPVVFGTLTRRTQKYTLADGTVKVGRAPSCLKVAGTGNASVVRIRRDREKFVAELVENGRRYRELQREYETLESVLAVLGALKKNS